jgi:acetyltransferase-like isoleucine patch superfamily enzyme
MPPRSHGDGRWEPADLGALGSGVVFERDVLIFNAPHVRIGDDVYVGHRTMLKGDTRGELVLEDGVWVGQDCYFQSAGGIRIGARTGVGPRVMVLTSVHEETPWPQPIIDAPLRFAPVTIGAGSDIGIGAILLPGTTIGTGVQVGAGAVVSGTVPDGAVVAGVPARVLRLREGAPV